MPKREIFKKEAQLFKNLRKQGYVPLPLDLNPSKVLRLKRTNMPANQPEFTLEEKMKFQAKMPVPETELFKALHAQKIHPYSEWAERIFKRIASGAWTGTWNMERWQKNKKRTFSSFQKKFAGDLGRRYNEYVSKQKKPI